MQKRRMAKAGGKLSTIAEERQGSGVGGQEGYPNGDRAISAPIITGRSLGKRAGSVMCF